MPSFTWTNAAWLAGYVAAMTALVWSLRAARDEAIEQFDNARAREKWDTFRDEVRQQNAERGPVERRVPQTDEPPTLLLLRDRFGLCVAAALVFGTALYAMLMLAIRGVMAKSPQHPMSDID